MSLYQMSLVVFFTAIGFFYLFAMTSDVLRVIVGVSALVAAFLLVTRHDNRSV